MMQRKAYLCIRVDEVVISCWCRMECSALRCLSDGGLKEASGLANECHSGGRLAVGERALGPLGDVFHR